MSRTTSLPAYTNTVNDRTAKGSLMLLWMPEDQRFVAIPEFGRSRYYSAVTPSSMARFNRLVKKRRDWSGSVTFGTYVRRPEARMRELFGKLPVLPYRAQATEELLAMVEAMG